jgi:alpha-tubulin suppressor-like RCC1 family protein
MKPPGIVIVVATVLATLFIHSAGHAATRARPLAETVLNDSAVRLAAGAAHTCQVNGDGTVRCWGFNGNGQLGDDTTTSRLTPVTVSGLTNAVAVTAGAFHTCALIADGSVRCWGGNDRAQLGDGTTTRRLTPVSVSFLTFGFEPIRVVAIAAGRDHTCALLANGSMRCWGANNTGQLGDGTDTTRPVPVTVSGLTNAVAIAAGDVHTCALLADSRVRCWGNNGGGQLGDGTTTTRFTPAPVSAVINAVAIAAGGFHTCALLADSGVVCWGGNKSGEVGDGIIGGSRLTRVNVGVDDAVAITAGHDHTCALDFDGPRVLGAQTVTVHCWGANNTGQLGDGTTTTRASPGPVSDLTNAVAVAAGTSHTCALLADGSARCWGDNFAGQLGNGTITDSLTPTTVAGGGGSVTARDIAAGFSHTCAVRANSTIACWGGNGNGQLGDGTTTDRLTPVPASNLTNAVAIAAGDVHTCALVLPGSSVHCWGLNGNGQLGDGTTTDRLTPVLVNLFTEAVALAAGGAHTCALRAGGSVHCWGLNGSGQLGDHTTTDRLSPGQVSPLTNAVAIAAGVAYTCALLADGSARCWGFNNNGQLGDGTTTDRLAPVSVSGLTNAVAIAGGGAHTCALLADGSARCWGSNFSGQLGDGTTTGRLTPVLVSGLTNAVAIAAGDFHTCALLGDGSARCWGGNFSGQLGNGTTSQRLSPTPVTIRLLRRTPSGAVFTEFPLGNIVQIATGASHTCAIIANGSVRCWGDNAFGQIGDGTTSDQLRPVSVPSFTLNIDPRVHVNRQSRVATVQILATCEAGHRLHVEVTLIQGSLSGHGVGVGTCTGALEHYPVRVRAHGHNTFLEGPAQVEAEALIRDRGLVVDTQEWTRQVQIVSAP